MQLAASQRAHPPPVPPRPSRQVVAEALKRSPRPPCPTRQAPAPPPNAKPWRSEDHEMTRRDGGGRTLIYESSTSNEAEIRSSSGEQQQRARPRDEKCLPRRRSNEEIVAPSSHNICREHAKEKIVDNRISREPSERYDEEEEKEEEEAENHRERHDGRCDEKKSQLQHRASPGDNENEELSARERTRQQRVNRQRAEISCRIAPVGNEYFENGDKTRENDCTWRRNGDATVRNFDETCSDEIEKAVEKENREVENVARSEHTRSAKNSEIHASRTPTPKNPRVTSEDEVDLNKNKSMSTCQGGGGDDSIEKSYGSATTVSSDDCTTVVVIDEPERKIGINEDNDNIHHRDWLEAGVRYSSTKITLSGDEGTDRSDESSRNNESRKHDFASIRDRIAMSSLQGLPPLPRSLSGFNLNEGRREAGEPPPPPARSSSKTPKNVKSTQPSSSKPSPPGRQLTTLDTQLAILRKEMFGLRQLDLSLLSQLWSLNESIQEFRQLLQEQEDRAPSPSPSSEEGDDTSYGSHPPPPPRRPAPLLHHNKPPRPPRPLRPPASDESPSSEEYGAV